MKVIVNRTDAIGDLILTTPIAHAIKSAHPDAHITFLISKKCEDIARNCPFIDSYHIVSRKNFVADFFELWKVIKHSAADVYLHLGGRQMPNFLAYLAHIPFRGGLRSKWQTFVFLNKAVRQKRSLVEMHEVEYNLQTLAPLGLKKLVPQHYCPQFSLPELLRTQDYLHFVDSLPHHLKDFKKIIFIHPGMTGHTLNWPEQNYALLISKLFQIYGRDFLFVVSHTPSDSRYILKVKSALDEFPEVSQQIFFFDGTLKGLQHYMNILSHAALFVGPSTGTTHIANVLGVNTIGLYSPIKVQSAKRWGLSMTNVMRNRVLVPDVICGERFQCAGEACPYFPCMGVISVDQVIQSINELLAGEEK